jgi:hypothetical protein
MAGRDPHGPDPDDWFDEPNVPPELRPRNAAEQEQPIVVDDWLTSEEAAPGGKLRVGDFELTRRQAALGGGALVLVVLVIGLAAGGVFSGGTTPQATTDTGSGLTTTTGGGATTPQSTPTAAVKGPTATLKPGDAGPQVRALQRALATLGYSPGKPDGKYGTATQQAVAAFQKANNLTPDGILGNVTLAALTSALSQSG